MTIKIVTLFDEQLNLITDINSINSIKNIDPLICLIKSRDNILLYIGRWALK
jgi:hypothetical protein